MNINNPTTFSTPDLTLGTANSSGTAGALRADDTILVYDTTNPAAVGASAVVGSAATSARRDHVHAGVVAITSTDEAIARFNGTAGALQNYSSNAPTISGAGIISLTSGALKFPATAIASTDANTLDDYEEGTWTPVLYQTGTSNDATSSTAIGRYTRIGNMVFLQGFLVITSLGSMTGTSSCSIKGLPFPSEATTANQGSCLFGAANDLAITADSTISGKIDANTSHIQLQVWDEAQGVGVMTANEWSANGNGVFVVSYEV